MPEEKKNMPTVDEQYQRLIAARNFHYDNLNKWLMSFYAIIGALFVAFYKLYSEHPNDDFVIVIALTGYVASVACYLSIKGYYYWEYKWIEKIHRFEKDVLHYDHDDMQVYSALVNHKKHDSPFNPIDGACVSTTQVALVITFIVICAWGVYLAIRIVPMDCLGMYPKLRLVLQGLVAIVVSYGLSVAGAFGLRSKIEEMDELPSK